MQITDLAPTIENMFGIDVPKKIMGQDVFDQEYDGISVFPEYTWVTDKAFVVDGTARNNNGLDDRKIQSINQYVGRFYSVNDAILDSNYYGR